MFAEYNLLLIKKSKQMIKGFENETHNLSDYELKVVIPLLIKGFKTKIGKENSITNVNICKLVNENSNLKIKLNEPRVRKCIAFLRYNNCVPRLVATSKGYWVASNKQELIDWEETLQSRIDAIIDIRDYAKNQIENWDNRYTQNKLNI